jgi:hypothetical protein
MLNTSEEIGLLLLSAAHLLICGIWYINVERREWAFI